MTPAVPVCVGLLAMLVALVGAAWEWSRPDPVSPRRVVAGPAWRIVPPEPEAPLLDWATLDEGGTAA